MRAKRRSQRHRRRRLNVKGIGLVLLVLLAIVGAGFGIYYLIDSNKLTIVLNGSEVMELDYEMLYKEPGAYVIKKGEVTDHEVEIDASKVNTAELGEYEVVYKIKGKRRHKKIRKVKVMDKEMPNVIYNGWDVSIPINGTYHEQGFKAFDNIDGDISDRVKVSDNIDISTKGVYHVRYEVADAAGNVYSTTRRVYVGMPIPSEEELTYNYSNNLDLKHQIRKMGWNSVGFTLEGHYNKPISSLDLLKDDGKTVYSFDAKSSLAGYSVAFDLSEVENGIYTIVASEYENDAIVNELDATTRLIRTKMGDKLVTFDYENNIMKVLIEDLVYEYDIVIESGHGGKDPGAINNTISERDLNLLVSMYERDRFEAHGLRVKLDRTINNTYGEQMGSETWSDLKRNSYAMGTYGTVARFSYGNHHNSSGNSSVGGWEIIVPAAATKEELAIENKIGNEWDKVFNNGTRGRIFTRSHETGIFHDKRNGQVYSFLEYYGMQRLNKYVFGLNYPTYENSYLSNPTEFKWYYTDGNWKRVSEVKIKHYVEAMGLDYIAP